MHTPSQLALCAALAEEEADELCDARVGEDDGGGDAGLLDIDYFDGG
jgi:hypothetical protein